MKKLLTISMVVLLIFITLFTVEKGKVNRFNEELESLYDIQIHNLKVLEKTISGSSTTLTEIYGTLQHITGIYTALNYSNNKGFANKVDKDAGLLLELQFSLRKFAEENYNTKEDRLFLSDITKRVAEVLENERDQIGSFRSTLMKETESYINDRK
ncbi:hypothetical protein [Paenibacillus sp. Marseille-Q4541]|uniref:hypothetical protein n=1 Tax=Paenibacillus sp. Marseille-Q4541 TaxID=2831522 RepID=UPI001BA5BFC6|nr:hypothetical protein [Paenibacillus sp. Marseille-Q4541]